MEIFLLPIHSRRKYNGNSAGCKYREQLWTYRLSEGNVGQFKKRLAYRYWVSFVIKQFFFSNHKIRSYTYKKLLDQSWHYLQSYWIEFYQLYFRKFIIKKARRKSPRIFVFTLPHRTIFYHKIKREKKNYFKN